jgi:hypothetical protein
MCKKINRNSTKRWQLWGAAQQSVLRLGEVEELRLIQTNLKRLFLLFKSFGRVYKPTY